MSEVPSEPEAADSGLHPAPEWGPDAIATSFRDGPVTFYRGLSIVLAVAAVGSVVFLAPAFAASAWAVVLALVVLALLGLSAVNFHLLARHGHEQPAVVLTRERLEVLVPFNKVSVDLAAITNVTILSRDLIVLAPGGIHTRGRASRAKRAVINNVRSFAVDRTRLAALIEERARAARRQA